MNAEFIGALKDLVKEKGISEDLIFTTWLLHIRKIMQILIQLLKM